MSVARRLGWLDLLLALLVLGAAGGLRGWYLITFAEGGEAGLHNVWQVQQPSEPASAEQTVLDRLVANIKEQGPLSGFRAQAPLAAAEEVTGHIAPAYPLFRAYTEMAAGWVGYAEKPAVVVRWVQVGLGALTALLYFLLARHAFASVVVGLLAGLGTALHPFWVINVAEMQDGVLATFFIALALYLAVRAGLKAGALTSLLLGLALALCCLTRGSLMPFSIVVLLWFMWRSRSLAQGWLCALVAFFGFLSGLSTWLVRDFQELGAPVPVVTTTWWHVWVGNNPQTTGGPATPEMLALLADRQADLAQTPQAQRYAKLADLVKHEVLEEPSQTLVRRGRAALYFLFGTKNPNRNTILDKAGGPEIEPWVKNTLMGVLVGLLPLAILGWRWSYGWKRASAPLALAVYWLPLPFLLTHAEHLHGPRLPLDGVLICLAALAVACLTPGIGGPLLRGEDALPPADPPSE
ncbi:MAG TPA: glycosyltransferase family 39 protein [Gemmatales bacterium]|nr:glycosyltransferase family 39 protein [Gemmatales bacterium]